MENKQTGLIPTEQGTQALATITSEVSLRVYAPDRLPKIKQTTPRDVLVLMKQTPVSSLRTFARQDETKTVALIKLHLVNLNKMCDVRRPLTEAQIDVIADTMITDSLLAQMSMLDFMVVMRRAITGYYGEMFESLTPPKVLGWLNKYMDERMTEAATMSAQEAMSYKSDLTRSRYANEQAAKKSEQALHAVALEMMKNKTYK